jgi:hypothetical protein
VFGGETYDESQDGDRLRAQFAAVFALMSDGEWRTLNEIRAQTGGVWETQSLSARLRDFRKPKFGAHIVDKERVPGANGLWRYRLITVPDEEKELY